jgi:hypothetical protein
MADHDARAQDLRQMSAERVDLLQLCVGLREHPEFNETVRGAQVLLVRV